MPQAAIAAVGGIASIGGALIGANSAKKAADVQVQAADRAAKVQQDIFDQTRADLAPFRQVGTQALFALADLFGVPRPADGVSSGTANGESLDSNFALPESPSILDPSNPADAATLRSLGVIRGKFGKKDARRLADFNNARLAAFNTQLSQARTSQSDNPVFTTPSFSGFKASPGFQFRLNQGVQALDRSAAARGRLLSGAQLKSVQRFGDGLASQEFNTFADRLAQLAGIGQGATQSGTSLANTQSRLIGNAIQDGGAARASGFTNQANSIIGGISNLAQVGVNFIQNPG